MKRVLITGCGGAPSLGFTRSLRDDDPKNEKYFIVGVDYGKFTVHRNECDKSFICPQSEDEKYIPFIKKIIELEKIEFMHTQPEPEVFVIGKHRYEIMETGCRLFMPAQKTIEILRDKGESYRFWKAAGIKVPETMEINDEEDLRKAFEKFGRDIWIRERVGAAGKGSLSRPSFELAKEQINSRNGWGKTVAAEHLTEKTITWQSIWHDGRLVVGQGREREYWEMSSRTQSGVTGLTGTGLLVKNSELDELSIKCIQAVDKKPNGIFGVDFTYDSEGTPNPTEINIGKFFTTHHFFTRAGCNMPKILVELAFDEYRGDYNMLNPCKENLCWVRGMDIKPVLIEYEKIVEKENEYQNLLKDIR